MNTSWIRALALVAPLLAAGCGGGGGGGAMVDAAGGTATVGVTITDAPVGRWDEAIATITSVELIGDDGQVTLFSGSETLDLLKLADFSELFAVSDTVPAGTYSKIRLRLSDLVLRDLDDAGNVIDTEQPQLVGNGKIDLNPRGDFYLAPGDVIVIELDFDMEKSLKITETGNGKLIIRPVVFVNIRNQPPPDGRLTRIHGEITAIDAVNQDFRLCQTLFASQWDDDHGDDDGPIGDRRCITVNSDDGTGIFGSDGLPEDFADLAVGEEATAIGRLRPVDEDDDADFDAQGGSDDGDHFFALDAYVVEEGPLGTFRRIRGVVDSDFDAGSGTFGLEIAPGQGIASDAPLPVQLFDKSRVFNRSGDELAPADILAGRAALADGVLVIGDEDLLRSPLVILGDSDAPEAATLEGEIVSINEEELALMVNDGTLDRCVDVAAADIFLVEDSDGFSSSRGSLSDLSPGQRVSIFGTEGIDGCLTADTVLAED